MAELSRRRFLQGSAAAGLAVALGRLPTIPPAAPVGLTAPVVAKIFDLPEAMLAGAERHSVYIPVTDQALRDAETVRMLLDAHLQGGVTGRTDGKVWTLR